MGFIIQLTYLKKSFKLKNDGYIKYKKVSFLEYCLALFIWVWFDDDSNYDTHDGNESEETLLISLLEYF